MHKKLQTFREYPSVTPWMTIPHKMSLWWPSICHKAFGWGTWYCLHFPMRSHIPCPKRSMRFIESMTCWCWIRREWMACKHPMHPMMYAQPPVGFSCWYSQTKLSRSLSLMSEYPVSIPSSFLRILRVFRSMPRMLTKTVVEICRPFRKASWRTWGSIFFLGQPRFPVCTAWMCWGTDIPEADLKKFMSHLHHMITLAMIFFTYSFFADTHASSMRAKSTVNSVAMSSIQPWGSDSDFADSSNNTRRG